MFDVELAYIDDHHDVMDVQEKSLRHALRAVAENAERELDLLDVDLDVPEDDFPGSPSTRRSTSSKTEFGHFPDDPTDLDTKGEKLLGQHFEEQGHPRSSSSATRREVLLHAGRRGRRHRLAEVRPHL